MANGTMRTSTNKLNRQGSRKGRILTLNLEPFLFRLAERKLFSSADLQRHLFNNEDQQIPTATTTVRWLVSTNKSVMIACRRCCDINSRTSHETHIICAHNIPWNNLGGRETQNTSQDNTVGEKLIYRRIFTWTTAEFARPWSFEVLDKFQRERSCNQHMWELGRRRLWVESIWYESKTLSLDVHFGSSVSE